MVFTEKQKGVVRGVIPAALLSLAGLLLGALTLPVNIVHGPEAGPRVGWGLQWALLPMLALMVCVIRVANHRFATPEDIDGSGLSSGTARVLVLRAILQNTLEQAVLATAAYLIWAIAMPLSWLGAIPAAAVLFIIGRILFARGYEGGAPGRATGFGLTAYPTFAMLIVAAIALVLQLLRINT